MCQTRRYEAQLRVHRLCEMVWDIDHREVEVEEL